MTEQDFAALARQGFNRIPLILETFADLDTPLSIYLKLANRPYSCLLESVIGGERFGRYSIIGLPARETLRVTGNDVLLQRGREVVENRFVQDPLAYIEKYQARFKVAPLPENLRFAGGLTGYFGYDAVRYVEPRLAGLQRPDVLGTPDILLMLSEELAVVDNLSGKLSLVVYADPGQPDAFAAGMRRLTELRLALRQSAPLPVYVPRPDRDPPESEIGQAAFLEAVERCKQYIFDGDIMQVQISQRISQRFEAPPVNLYRALRSINPSPYMFYFDFDDFHVIGASPEILVRREQDRIVVRPIAGTRKRGATPERDRELEAELLADPKERAEHLMLIDLGRNDIGRVAETGSVRVTESFVVERYSHVMHIVSNVEGRLRPDVSNMELFRATFPAGTVTGTPKVRAMEIISELEPSKRGIYAGAVGYLGFNGNMDLAIAIRTAVVKDRTLYAQAAAGIVADSVPALEWMETENKARAVLKAAEMVMEGLDTISG